MVPKAFKEVKQQVDIVGKGRGDHGDSSWKGFAVFSRRTCHYRLCQVIYAHPSVKCLHARARPRRGGAAVVCDGQHAGVFNDWHWRWSPTYDKALGTPGGVSVTLSTHWTRTLLQVSGMRWIRMLRALVLTREADYGRGQA